jgi:hemolysin activation/secretion protein
MKYASLGMTLAVIGLASPVLADTTPRLDPAIELQRQQQEQLIQRQIQAPRPSVESEGPRVPAEPSSVACVNVTKVTVSGVRVLASSDLLPALSPFEGRCLTQADVGQLLQAINALYVDRGYITSRAYLPEQDVSDGLLRIVVIEGTVEDILLNDNQRKADRRRVVMAFPSRNNQVLRLADIEQGVDQLNRAPSAQAAVAMEPGHLAGKTRVVVKTVDDGTWRAGLALDNNGEEATGELKTTGTLDKDNLLEANDVWQLALSHTEDTRALSLNVSVPYGC